MFTYWFETLKGFDAIYFGAVGWPDKVPDHISLWGSLLKFRRDFDQYVNIRPARCVLGGYVLSHGKIAALIQPFEVLIIGGAALGAFLQANPGYMTLHVLKKSLGMFGSRFSHAFYLEVLGLVYEILNKSRREGMMAIEADIEDAAASPIFAKYPTILKDERMTAFICDYLRIMSSGNMPSRRLLFRIS